MSGAISHEEVGNNTLTLQIDRDLCVPGAIHALYHHLPHLGLVPAVYAEFMCLVQEVKQMNLWRNCTIAGKSQNLRTPEAHPPRLGQSPVSSPVSGSAGIFLDAAPQPMYAVHRGFRCHSTCVFGMQLFLSALA